jgi:hypothetical protein
MAIGKKKTEAKPIPPNLKQLVLNIADEYASRDERQKAGALRDLVADMDMPSVKALEAAIANGGVSPEELGVLSLASVVASLR